MHKPRKTGGLQLSCNNKFAGVVSAVVQNDPLENQGQLFKDWIPLVLDETEGLNYVNAFKACKTTDKD